jgi:hypothetical protein
MPARAGHRPHGGPHPEGPDERAPARPRPDPRQPGSRPPLPPSPWRLPRGGRARQRRDRFRPARPVAASASLLAASAGVSVSRAPTTAPRRCADWPARSTRASGTPPGAAARASAVRRRGRPRRGEHERRQRGACLDPGRARLSRLTGRRRADVVRPARRARPSRASTPGLTAAPSTTTRRRPSSVVAMINSRFEVTTKAGAVTFGPSTTRSSRARTRSSPWPSPATRRTATRTRGCNGDTSVPITRGQNNTAAGIRGRHPGRQRAAAGDARRLHRRAVHAQLRRHRLGAVRPRHEPHRRRIAGALNA